MPGNITSIEASGGPAAAGGSTVKGAINVVAFKSQDGFAILILTCGTTVKGHLEKPMFGQEYEFFGRWEDHPRFGRQFKFDSYRAELPTTPSAIHQYLAEHCTGIGQVLADRLVSFYGADTLKILKERPEEVCVPGVGPELAQSVSKELRAHEEEEQLELDLSSLLAEARVPKSTVRKVKLAWRKEAPARIKANPYDLIRFPRVGFRTADQVAVSIGYDRRSPFRIRAALVHALGTDARSSGHVCLPYRELASSSMILLGGDVGQPQVEEILQAMIGAAEIILNGGQGPALAERFCWLPSALEDEQEIAERITTLREHSGAIPGFISQEILEGLKPDQKVALEKAISEKVMILTGAPGTGKTHTVKRILSAFPDARILLAAPTGKAAKRLSELCGRKAMTIHKALKPVPRVSEEDEEELSFAFGYGADNRLEADLVIIDESSMLDEWLAARLLAAIPNSARLILVGDIYQLPSVGPGNVLRDLIHSGEIPSIELTEIKRQNPGLIVTCCHRIKDGKDIDTNSPAGTEPDLYFVQRDKEDQIRDLVADFVIDRLPKKYADPAGDTNEKQVIEILDPLMDIQVITALREKTLLGTKELNAVLQKRYQAKIGHRLIEGFGFAPGDKVIYNRNTILFRNSGERDLYKKATKDLRLATAAKDTTLIAESLQTIERLNCIQVVNGDIGVVEKIIEIDSRRGVVVDFIGGEEDRRLIVAGDDLQDLRLAYAITTHKFQGSECPIVVIPIHRCFGPKISQRSWLYTSISRARSLCILVGQRGETWKMVRRMDQHLRYSGLVERLQEAIS